jgi:hypothetical protein
VRGKAIIIGAMGVVALATLTVNAQNSTSRTATKGSVTTLLAATTRLASEREEVSLVVRATALAAQAPATSKPSEKTEVETKAVEPKLTITTGCQAAITNLKAMHTADVAEDSTERASAQPESATATAADQAEDATEAGKWKTALTAARTACVPQPTTACRAAITGLETTLTALHTEELGELQASTRIDWTADFSGVRTAFSAVQTACPERE